MLFVCGLAAAAWSRPLGRSRQLRVSGLAVSAVITIGLTQLSALRLSPLASSVLRDWIPAAVLLVPYWQVGQFFKGPDPQIEERLAAFDSRFFRALGIDPGKAVISAATAAYLEWAYVTVYPLIPFGLAALYLVGLRDLASYYWIVVLLTTYFCYIITLFVRAMPPRLRSDYERFHMPPSKLAWLNSWILRGAGIQAITFPSAHVASAMAAALVLLRVEPWIGLIFIVVAVSIAVATVVGGYHYAADALLASVLAIVVFWMTWWTMRPT